MSPRKLESPPVIPVVVLSAGMSTRMGQPKALLPVSDTDTFLTRIVRTFLEAGVDDVVVVLGHEAPRIAARLAATGLPARVVVNEQYRKRPVLVGAGRAERGRSSGWYAHCC